MMALQRAKAPLRRMASIGPTAVATLLYIGMYAIYALRTPSAITTFGITNLMNDTIVLAIAAAGLTIVVLVGELDLSGVAVIAIANCITATISTGNFGWIISLAAVLATGACVGLLNGILVSVFGLQSLAATIGTMIGCEGIALLILPAPGGSVSNVIANRLTGDVTDIIPVAALILAGFWAVWLALKRTPLGVALYAIGADAPSARLSGVDERRTKLAAFIIAGICYAAAGYMLSAQTGTGNPRASDALLLFMYAAVAIGGTSLIGGRGGVFGSIIGAGILAVMQKMLFSLGVANFYTDVFDGLIMIFALIIGGASTLLAQRMRAGAP